MSIQSDYPSKKRTLSQINALSPKDFLLLINVQSEYISQTRTLKQINGLSSREKDYLDSAYISMFSVGDIPSGVHILEGMLNSIFLDEDPDNTHDKMLELYTFACRAYKLPVNIKPYKTRVSEAEETRKS